MPPQPRVKLSRLRDIGWSSWDPIGLLNPSERWDEGDNQNFADEYDRYLVSASAQLRDGAPYEQVIDYLVEIETQHMGLTERPDTRTRAKTVVEAIMADDTIWTWADERERFK